MPLAEDLAVIGADQRPVSVGRPLPPMVDRIRLAVDHMDHGRAEAQVVDILHIAADLVDVAEVGRRGVVAGAEHAVGRGQRDQDWGDRGAVVAAHDQDGGQVVADVMGMGQRGAVGLGGMAAEAQRRPIVDGQEDAGPLGDLLPDRRVHRLDQGRLLDARVDAEPPQLLGEGGRFEPGHGGPGPGAVLEPVLPKPLTSMA